MPLNSSLGNKRETLSQKKKKIFYTHTHTHRGLGNKSKTLSQKKKKGFFALLIFIKKIFLHTHTHTHILRPRWLIPIIPALWEAEVGRS